MRLRAVLAAAVLAGCAATPPPSPAPRAAIAVVPAPPGTGERLIAALSRMGAMDERALAAEIARTGEAARRQRTAFARVEAALALSLSEDPDDARILAYVAPVLDERPPSDPALRAMAGFLHGIASDRRKLKDDVAAATSKSREERREAQSQRLRAEAQQQRADRLQQKLEALTELEKSLATRNHADDPDRHPR
jgi:cell division protein FtsL